MACLVFFTIYLPVALLAQGLEDTGYVRLHYQKHEYMIPMRDGVRLFTAVYVPKDTSTAYPFLLNRTCYSVAPYGEDAYPDELGPSPAFTKSGFIFVYQDVRGKCHSEGTWVEIRPFVAHKTGHQIDESTDAYDTVDWLLKHIRHNNGKVGVWGISYPGFFATNAALSAHPAIRAVSPQAPVTNWFLGDDTHHNGAFFLQDEFDFDYDFHNTTNGPQKGRMPPLKAHQDDNYAFFLKMGTVAAVNKYYYHHRVPFWDTILMHPDYDAWWKARDIRRFMGHVRAATLVVGGWYDAEDQWGTMETYSHIEKDNPGNENTLVMGPWYHGGWAAPDMDHLGDISFGFNTSRWFQQHVAFPFFMHYLKGIPLEPLPEALLYDVGQNRWLAFDKWPGTRIIPRTLYFRENDSLSFTPPLLGNSRSEYRSDPARPVPYQAGIRKERGITYMDADQRFASRRPDVLTFSTAVLDSNITLAGRLRANLYVSTTGTDADFIIKLIDVYPEGSETEGPGRGYEALVRAEVMRGKYRNGFEKPEPFVPGKPTLVSFHVPDVLYTFKKGHRIMIQVQSSWFPLVDRNPQVFENIYTAAPGDFKKATIFLYHQKEFPSSLETGILPQDRQSGYRIPEN